MHLTNVTIKRSSSASSANFQPKHQTNETSNENSKIRNLSGCCKCSPRIQRICFCFNLKLIELSNFQEFKHSRLVVLEHCSSMNTFSGLERRSIQKKLNFVWWAISFAMTGLCVTINYPSCKIKRWSTFSGVCVNRRSQAEVFRHSTSWLCKLVCDRLLSIGTFEERGEMKRIQNDQIRRISFDRGCLSPTQLR